MRSLRLATGTIRGASALVAAGVLAFGTAYVVCPPVKARSPYAAWEQARPRPRPGPGSNLNVPEIMANVTTPLGEVKPPVAKEDLRDRSVIISVLIASDPSKSTACVKARDGSQAVVRAGGSFLGFRISAVDSASVAFTDGYIINKRSTSR